MSRKRFIAEQIIVKIREVEIIESKSLETKPKTNIESPKPTIARNASFSPFCDLMFFNFCATSYDCQCRLVRLYLWCRSGLGVDRYTH